MSICSNFFNGFGAGFGFGMYMNNPFFGGFCSPFGFNNPFMCGCNFYSYPGFTAPSLFSMPVPSFGSAFNYAGMSNFGQSSTNIGFVNTTMPDFTNPNINIFGSSTNVSNTNTFTSNTATSSTSFTTSTTSSTTRTTSSTTKSSNSKKTKTQTEQRQNEPINYDANTLKSRWQSKKADLSNNFYNKVIDISKKINCDPNDLMALMYSESQLKSTAVNRSSGATGLIQFMPNTAKSFDTTTSRLKSMSPEEQLTYVEKYFINQKQHANLGNKQLDRGTLYALCFLPKFAHQEVLCKKGSKYYAQNKGLDLNKDGKITKTELSNRITQFLA